MNLTEITYTKIFENKMTPFFKGEKNENPHAEIVEYPCYISQKKCCAFEFRFKNHKTELTSFYHDEGVIKAV